MAKKVDEPVVENTPDDDDAPVKMVHPDNPDNVVATTRRAFDQVYAELGWEEADPDTPVTAENVPRRPNPDKVDVVADEQALNEPNPIIDEEFNDLANS